MCFCSLPWNSTRILYGRAQLESPSRWALRFRIVRISNTRNANPKTCGEQKGKPLQINQILCFGFRRLRIKKCPLSQLSPLPQISLQGLEKSTVLSQMSIGTCTILHKPLLWGYLKHGITFDSLVLCKFPVKCLLWKKKKTTNTKIKDTGYQYTRNRWKLEKLGEGRRVISFPFIYCVLAGNVLLLCLSKRSDTIMSNWKKKKKRNKKENQID